MVSLTLVFLGGSAFVARHEWFSVWTVEGASKENDVWANQQLQGPVVVVVVMVVV